jgi:hypothetical protein
MRKRRDSEEAQVVEPPQPAEVADCPHDAFQRMLGEREIVVGTRVELLEADRPYAETEDEYDSSYRYTRESYSLADVQASADLNKRFSLGNRGDSDQYTVPDGWISVGETVYVVLERYSTGDTFGERTGLARTHAAFATYEAALAFTRANAGALASGWFDTSDGFEIREVTLED